MKGNEEDGFKFIPRTEEESTSQSDFDSHRVTQKVFCWVQLISLSHLGYGKSFVATTIGQNLILVKVESRSKVEY